MKRNLISIIILVLLIVNTVLTAIMMFSVVSTNSKTAALVTDIASAINLDLNANRGNAQVNVPIADVVTYTISDLQILLKKETPVDGEEADDKDHYAVLAVTLSMNSKHKDYKTYGEDMSSREDLIRGEIIEVVQQYTLKEAQSHPEQIQNDILERVQQLFDSDFVFDVSLSNKLLQ